MATSTNEYWWIHAQPGRIHVAACGGGAQPPLLVGPFTALDQVMLPDGARVALCVPGSEVRIHEVTLPARNRRKFLAALPYTLEERLLGDPEEQHFVPLPAARGADVLPVAVVARQRLIEWRDAIDARGWRLLRLHPDYLYLPAPAAGTWLIDARETPLLLRRPEGGAVLSGCAGLADLPPRALTLALEAAAAAPHRIELKVVSEADAILAAGWRPALAARDIELAIEIDAEPRVAALARQAPPDDHCNLLTGSFAPAREAVTPLRRFVPTAALGTALLAAFLTQWLIDGARLATRHEALLDAIEAQYRALRPEARNIVDPRFQMETELERLRATRANQREPLDLLTALDRSSTALAANPTIRILSLGFDADGLRVELEANDFEALSALPAQLAESGAVTLDDTRLEDNVVRGTLRLTEPGP